MFLHRAKPAALLAFCLTLAVSGCVGGDRDAHATALTGGTPERGRSLIRQYGCGSCHTIPGIAGATATVGPPLEGIATRAYIGGVLENSPGNMIAWILDPKAADEKTAMPRLGVTPAQARDIAAYLYTLR